MRAPVPDTRTDQFVAASVGVYVGFENLVCGATRGLPGLERTDEERRDLHNVAMLACSFGCDALHESR
jgi:hypothetical protein